MSVNSAGKERDQESGLDYFGARYYGSALGRFTSPDWSAKAEPVPYAAFSNPQSLNLYIYVLNNPLFRPDIDGHGPWDLIRQWLDVVNVKASAGIGVGVGGRAGHVELKAEASLAKAEVHSGLGGGNADASIRTGAKATAKLGPVEGSVKVSVEASAREGVSGGVSAEAKAGGAGLEAGVKADSSGVHAEAGSVEKKGDFVIGADVNAVIGLGLDINFSQIGRAWSETVTSAGQAVDDVKRMAGITGTTLPILPSLTPSSVVPPQ